MVKLQRGYKGILLRSNYSDPYIAHETNHDEEAKIFAPTHLGLKRKTPLP